MACSIQHTVYNPVIPHRIMKRNLQPIIIVHETMLQCYITLILVYMIQWYIHVTFTYHHLNIIILILILILLLLFVVFLVKGINYNSIIIVSNIITQFHIMKRLTIIVILNHDVISNQWVFTFHAHCAVASRPPLLGTIWSGLCQITPATTSQPADCKRYAPRVSNTPLAHGLGN